MRIQLVQSTFMDELVEFLGRCQCRVSSARAGLIDIHLHPEVSQEAAMRLLEPGSCYRCGAPVEEVLQRLGSPACMDCRDRPNGAPQSNGNGHAALRHRWARFEVDSYLRVWNAKHPEALAQLLD